MKKESQMARFEFVKNVDLQNLFEIDKFGLTCVDCGNKTNGVVPGKETPRQNRFGI